MTVLAAESGVLVAAAYDPDAESYRAISKLDSFSPSASVSAYWTVRSA